MKNIIFPRSSYHLQLVKQNLEGDMVFLITENRTEKAIRFYFPMAEIVFLGDESSYSFNGKKIYYGKVLDIVSRYGEHEPVRYIIFGLDTPFQKFLVNSFNFKNFELWEDGLNYYLEFYNGKWYYLKSTVKNLLGYYSKGCYNSTYKKDAIIKKDRFKNKKLFYKTNFSDNAVVKPNHVLYFGQPLIEDNVLSRRNMLAGFLKVKNRYQNYEIDYLPHPREKKLSRNLALKAGFNVLENDFVSAEDLASNYIYDAYISAYSTVNVNLPNEASSEFVAVDFGLLAIRKKLFNELGNAFKVW